MEEQLTSISSIPSGLQILLKDLDYLGQIPRGLKPCVNSRDFIDDSTWSGWFYRHFIIKESREGVLAEVEKIVDRSVEAIKNHKDTEYIKLIIEYFYKARTGVANLLTTYKGSPDIVSRINVQLTNMDLQIKKYQKYIDGYKPEIKKEEFFIGETPPPPTIPMPPSTVETPPSRSFSELDLTSGEEPTRKTKKTFKIKKHVD